MVDSIDAIRASQRDDYLELDSEDDPEDPSSLMLSHNIQLFLAVVALICVTALEPVLLKVMADHTMVDELRDYRYVLAQLLMLTHVPLAIGSAIWYSCKYSRNAMESCDFPKTWFVLLAFLNALHLIMQVVSSGSVPAPLTILLVNASIPLTKLFGALLTGVMIAVRYWMPNLPEYWLSDDSPAEPMLQQAQHQLMLEQRNRQQQQNASRVNLSPEVTSDAGCFRLAFERTLKKTRRFIVNQPYAIMSMFLVVCGVAIGLFPVISNSVSALGAKSYCHVYNADCASSTLIFLLAAVPAALSAICEERTLVRYSLPVAPMMLHGWLVPMQFLFGVILAPIGRHLQHPTRKWSNVSMELHGLDEEVSQGLQCILLGKETGIGYIGHADPDWCKPLLPLLILFLLVSFSYHMLTLYIMRKATELCLRICTALAIPIGWSALIIYDINFQPNVSKDVPTQIVVSSYNKVALVLIVLSMFLHKTIAEPETSYILTSPFEERDRISIEAASERHRRTLMQARSQDNGSEVRLPSHEIL
ncbi:Crt-like 3 [Hondaea fermentalgiana]|uniref:Crt-like 3 n=1 Tax=Hondaea fermentalgiana TaxID=2315210 RepID=A0A2R5G1J3_9STRA|nr:Crt-like 3 [Hondaea fermentalgiana]|eukprot:GBG24862.1 Crt-like 3 [Hondaea fermentalgiana]